MFRLTAVVVLAACAAHALDLTKATVIAPESFGTREKKAVSVLIEEVEKRANVRWPVAAKSAAQPAINLSLVQSKPAEGFALRVTAGGVTITGNDSRGVLFGIGYLLRQLRMSPGRVEAPDGLGITTAPRYGLRGHQLGYRPKTNSYDAWTLTVWDQYIRDLAVFGTNAIELIPPRSDDAATSPHFPLPQMETMIGMSRISDEYGLDVWIWYPAMDKDYSDPATVEFALKEWGEVFRKLPRIDAVFVPGGDPGHTQPKYLMALLEKQAASLRRSHPRAQMWVSPQSFGQEWMDEFIGILKTEPAWLNGVVFGPQVRVSLAKLREMVPKRYPIRDYPDITHSLRSQYPVPDWDPAYGLTAHREPINPRPVGQTTIFRLMAPHTIGFLTYSEGCNDDVNKFIWSGLGWDPEARPIDTLRQYSRYFIGDPYADSFAQILMGLERNWQGPLATHSGVPATLAQLQEMERTASPAVLANWRFQQALYRGYYDAYTQARLRYETALSDRAMDHLRDASKTGALTAMKEAEDTLDRAMTHRVAAGLRSRVFEMAEALFQSIRMQLSVPRYKAIGVDRGANLDNIDFPLNNRPWLKERFAEIRRLESEAERLRAIQQIVDWTNPGPGGFYDDLGNPWSARHLVRGPGFQKDPAHLESALTAFGFRNSGRMEWWRHAESRDDTPLEMRYTDLDPTANYRLRIVYAGDAGPKKIRLVADENIEVHPYIDRPFPFRPVEFDVPATATRTGSLRLRFYREAGIGGAGRGPQVSEVWLMKKP